MNEKRSITINILPQSAGAWEAIAWLGMVLAVAWVFNGFAGCAAREAGALKP